MEKLLSQRQQGLHVRPSLPAPGPRDEGAHASVVQEARGRRAPGACERTCPGSMLCGRQQARHGALPTFLFGPRASVGIPRSHKCDLIGSVGHKMDGNVVIV